MSLVVFSITDFHLVETLLATLDFADFDEEERKTKRRGEEFLLQRSLR